MIELASPEWVRSPSYGPIERIIFGKHGPYERDYYSSMFVDDCSRIIPYKKGDHTVVHFKITSSNENIAEAIVCGLANDNYSRRPDSAIKNFIEGAVKNCLLYNRAIYFLHSGKHENEKENSYSLIDHSRQHFFKIFGMWFQYIPKSNDNSWSTTNEPSRRRICRIDTRKIIEIRIPSKERRLVRRLISKLKKLSKLRDVDMTNMLHRATIENPSPQPSNFDYSEFRRKLDLIFFRITKDIGWNGRDHSGEKQSDMFACIRMLRFKAFKLKLRDAILDQIGEQISLSVRDNVPDFEFRIAVDQLPTVEDVTKVRKNLLEHKTGFKDVVNFFYSE